MPNITTDILIPIVEESVKNVTPVILTAAQLAAQEIYRKAKETENPWDDIYAGMLLALTGAPAPSLATTESEPSQIGE